MVLPASPVSATRTFSPAPQPRKQKAGRASMDVLAATDRSQLGEGYRRTGSASRTPPRLATCLPLGLWPLRYERVRLYGIFQFAHSRQILTGKPPFPGMTKVAVTYSMLNGKRPPRPSHQKVSGVMWRMIQGCWNPVASRRMEIEEAVALLEEELGRIALSASKGVLGIDVYT